MTWTLAPALIIAGFLASIVAPFFWPQREDEMGEAHGDVTVPPEGWNWP